MHISGLLRGRNGNVLQCVAVCESVLQCVAVSLEAECCLASKE